MSVMVEVTNTPNTFFSNTVKNLKITKKFADPDLPHISSRHPTLNAILIYKDNPNITVIKRVSQRFSIFCFSWVDENTVLKEIRKLKSNKAVQDTVIPVKMLKDNGECFAENIYL